MPGWVDSPERYPHTCALVRNGEAQVGPFYDTGIDYFRPQVENGQLGVIPKLCRLYLSAQGIREFTQLNGSPMVTVPRANHQEAEAEIERLSDELADTAAMLVEAQAELASLKAQPPIDAEALAQALIVPLRSHFASRPGPKPKAA